MKPLFLLLLLCVSSTLHANDLLKSATDAVNSATSQDSGSTASSVTGGLTDAVMKGLGVSNNQASGGLGSLFSLAKSTLGNEQFSGLAKAVPGMDQLLKTAPAVEGSAKSLGGLSSALGGYGEALEGAGKVYSQFQSLGLDAAAIPKYVDITNSYLKSTGGQSAVDLFNKGVAALL